MGRAAGVDAARAAPAAATRRRRRSSSNLLGAAGLPADVVDAHRRRGRGQPALRRADPVDAGRQQAPCGRTTAAGSAARATATSTIPPTIKALLEARLGKLGARASARRSSRRRSSAWSSRRRRSRRWRRERIRPAIDEQLAALTRKQFVHRGRRPRTGLGLSLPPSPGARHRLQRPAEARARDAARRVRALGRQGQRRARSRPRVRGDPRLPPRAGAPVPRRARAARREGPRDRRATRRSGCLGRPARSFARGDMHAAGESVPARDRAAEGGRSAAPAAVAAISAKC